MKDFYIKNSEDNDDFRPLELEEDDAIDVYLAQISMVLGNEVPVMGAPDMIAGLDEYVFNTDIDAKGLESKIYDLIGKYCSLASEFPTTVTVKFYRGTVEKRDVCLIDVDVADTKTMRVRLS